MEKNKDGAVSGAAGEKVIVQQPEASPNDEAENNAASTVDSPTLQQQVSESGIAGSGRVPFTSLTQVESDMALARTLQDQERAYFLLQIGHSGGGLHDSDRLFYEGYQFDNEEDAVGEGEDEEDVDDEEEEGNLEEVNDDPEEAGADGRATDDEQINGASFDSDEAFARALQDEEYRDTTARLMALAGIHDMHGDIESDSNESQEGLWEDVDPDNMSYEELMALGEAVGTESKGLNPQLIADLPQFTFVSDSKDNTSDQEQCVVCRLDYEDGDKMLRLPCKHLYHSQCIQQWLERNKVCPICSAEVTSSASSTSAESRAA